MGLNVRPAVESSLKCMLYETMSPAHLPQVELFDFITAVDLVILQNK